jgi:hypothetical protein
VCRGAAGQKESEDGQSRAGKDSFQLPEVV